MTTVRVEPRKTPQAFPNQFGYGMTLRDYFAGQALAGLCAHESGPAGDWVSCAGHAYKAADAMLRERVK